MALVHLRELTLKQRQESNVGAKLGLVHIVSLNSSPVAFFHRDHLLATKITINTDPTNITIVESRARHRAFLVAEPPSKEEGFHTLLPRKPRRATTPRSRLPKRRGGLKRPSAWVAARDHRDCAVCASSAFRFTPESSIDSLHSLIQSGDRDSPQFHSRPHPQIRLPPGFSSTTRQLLHHGEPTLCALGCAVAHDPGDTVWPVVPRGDKEHERGSHPIPRDDGRRQDEATRPRTQRPAPRIHRQRLQVCDL